MPDPKVDHQLALAARAKTRIKAEGRRGLIGASLEEVQAMAWVCDLFLNDYPGPLSKGGPDMTCMLTQEVETSNERGS